MIEGSEDGGAYGGPVEAIEEAMGVAGEIAGVSGDRKADEDFLNTPWREELRARLERPVVRGGIDRMWFVVGVSALILSALGGMLLKDRAEVGAAVLKCLEDKGVQAELSKGVPEEILSCARVRLNGVLFINNGPHSVESRIRGRYHDLAAEGADEETK